MPLNIAKGSGQVLPMILHLKIFVDVAKVKHAWEKMQRKLGSRVHDPDTKGGSNCRYIPNWLVKILVDAESMCGLPGLTFALPNLKFFCAVFLRFEHEDRL